MLISKGPLGHLSAIFDDLNIYHVFTLSHVAPVEHGEHGDSVFGPYLP